MKKKAKFVIRCSWTKNLDSVIHFVVNSKKMQLDANSLLRNLMSRI